MKKKKIAFDCPIFRKFFDMKTLCSQIMKKRLCRNPTLVTFGKLAFIWP